MLLHAKYRNQVILQGQTAQGGDLYINITLGKCNPAAVCRCQRAKAVWNLRSVVLMRENDPDVPSEMENRRKYVSDRLKAMVNISEE
jgi:hypothetical protein